MRESYEKELITLVNNYIKGKYEQIKIKANFNLDEMSIEFFEKSNKSSFGNKLDKMRRSYKQLNEDQNKEQRLDTMMDYLSNLIPNREI